jgi:NADH:ubiquinone reductase (H+-translocating)
LEKLGVTVELGERCANADADGVVFGDQALRSKVILWAAGVRASAAATWLAFPADNANRVKVEPDLTVPGRPEIFAIGDTASIAPGAASPCPGSRRPPSSKAARRRDDPSGACAAIRAADPFRYRHSGNLATIGKRSAVIDFGWMQLARQRLAWWVWGLAHIYFLIGVRNRLAVALSWLWIYSTGNRSSCLITQGEKKSPALREEEALQE